MKSLIELKKQIEEYQHHIEVLKRQLEELQGRCEHDFLTTPLMKICKKCDLMNAEYY